MKILHIINSLDDGGAEIALAKLLENDKNHQHIVISVYEEKKILSRLEAAGAEIISLDLTRGKVIYAVFEISKIMRVKSPDVTVGWLYLGCLLAWIAAIKTQSSKLIFYIHNTNLSFLSSNRFTILIRLLLAPLSYFRVAKILYCADVARTVHEKIGYKRSVSEVLYNGYDLQAFDISSEPKVVTRKKLGLPEEPFLFGCIARYSPQKNHAGLIKAYAQIQSEKNHLVLVGRHCSSANIELVKMINDFKLADSVTLLGSRKDIADILSGLDVLVLASRFGEAFPNILCEAMSCGIQCIAHDVGDSKQILSRFGLIIPLEEKNGLSAAMQRCQSSHSAEDFRTERREHIKENFSIEIMVKKFDRIIAQEQ